MKLIYLKMCHYNSGLQCSISPTVKIFHPSITLNNYSPGSCPTTGTFPTSNKPEGAVEGGQKQLQDIYIYYIYRLKVGDEQQIC